MYELIENLLTFTSWSFIVIPVLYCLAMGMKDNDTDRAIKKTGPVFLFFFGLHVLVYTCHKGMDAVNSLDISTFLSQIIPMFFVQFFTYQLFFFNVPFRAGESMRDLSENRIYRSFYYIIAGFGRGISRIIEGSTRDLIGKTGQVTLFLLLNLLTYIFLLYQMTHLYDILSLTLLRIEASTFTLKGDFLDMFYNFQLLYAIVSAFGEVTGFSSFILAFSKSILFIVEYQLLTIFYFTTVYGLLEQKLEDLVFIPENPNNNTQITPYSMSSLIHSLKEGVVSFVGSLSYMTTMTQWQVLLPFSILMTFFGMFQLLQGETADGMGLFWAIIDSTNIPHVLISFFVGLILVKSTDYAGHCVYVILPPSLQQGIDALGNQLESWEQTIRNNNNNNNNNNPPPPNSPISQLQNRVNQLNFNRRP